MTRTARTMAETYTTAGPHVTIRDTWQGAGAYGRRQDGVRMLALECSTCGGHGTCGAYFAQATVSAWHADCKVDEVTARINRLDAVAEQGHAELLAWQLEGPAVQLALF